MEDNGKATGYYSKKMRAGRRRTYFFDVRSTRNGDYFITLTENKKRHDGGAQNHKIFLYKEDFAAFAENLNEAIDFIKNELNPDFDYDNYNREVYDEQRRLEREAEGESATEASE